MGTNQNRDINLSNFNSIDFIEQVLEQPIHTSVSWLGSSSYTFGTFKGRITHNDLVTAVSKTCLKALNECDFQDKNKRNVLADRVSKIEDCLIKLQGEAATISLMYFFSIVFIPFILIEHWINKNSYDEADSSYKAFKDTLSDFHSRRLDETWDEIALWRDYLKMKAAEFFSGLFKRFGQIPSGSNPVNNHTLTLEDHYAVLGLKSGATAAEVKRAFRKLALQNHPDKNPDDRKGAEERFKKIGASYVHIINILEPHTLPGE